MGAGAPPGPHPPHCLRHSAITFALDVGASLRDVQVYAGHKDPRTTRRYDVSRDSLDRNAADRRCLRGVTASRAYGMLSSIGCAATVPIAL